MDSASVGVLVFRISRMTLWGSTAGASSEAQDSASWPGSVYAGACTVLAAMFVIAATELDSATSASVRYGEFLRGKREQLDGDQGIVMP